ncbi:MAG: hypothetical protein HY673_19955 [Chloroflexi bacterium]|nr:hypothetical protein [Chloroflexota bacterium]
MVIVADFGSDVQTYCSEFPKLIFSKPKTCPNCAAARKLIGHGSYARHVCDHQQVFSIRVKRLFCTTCRRTISLLPSFCLSYRHYLTLVIQSVLSLRIQHNSSWNTIRQGFLPSDLPALSTCREWMSAFSQASGKYLQELLQQMSAWQLAPGKLELLIAELSVFSSQAQQLVAAVPHLVVWLRDSGLNLPNGSAKWLRTLWQWGHGAKLGRLV